MASILKVDTIQDQSGNNIINENADTITIGASGDTITVPTGATLDLSNATQTGVGGTNTPRFFATLSSNQSIADNGWVKVICDTEVIDSDSAYDPSTGRFTVPSGKGGQYTFSCAVDTAGLDSGQICMVVLYLNGIFSALGMGKFQSSAAAEDGPVTTTFMRSLSAGDYIEMYMYQNSGSAQNTRSGRTYFGGYKIIE
jgi:hypothetical protein